MRVATHIVIAATAVAVSAAAPAASSGNITKLYEAAARGAVCLDGTPAAFYYAPGDPERFYVHQEGGGWCYQNDDCLSRSKTRLGSSSSYAPSMGFNGGYFSNDPSINPLMASWSKIFLPYVMRRGRARML